MHQWGNAVSGKYLARPLGLLAVCGIAMYAGEARADAAAADYSYTGNSVSLLNGGGGAESTRPGYSLANMRFGIDHEKSEFSLNIHNLTNAKPNLGDIGYVGYAQYNAAGSVIPQVATLQPLTVIFQYKQGF
jgi:iron complex outermembrane receptor protein